MSLTVRNIQQRLKIFANNRTGILVDISRIMTERNIDVASMDVRTNKQGKATISMSFQVSDTEEISRVIEKLRQVESVLDIERN